MKIIPKSFKFSPLITLVAILLASAMLTASRWQWVRYQAAMKKLESYRKHNEIPAKDFPLEASFREDFASVMDQKVSLRGTYDFERQIIVSNRKHRSGPGHWLITPFTPEGSSTAVLVSRGFIPFKDDTPEEWEKYNFEKEITLDAVVTESVPHRTFLSPKSATGSGDWIRKWLYPDIEKIAKQFPYPVVTTIFLKKLGTPPQGEFPAQAISVYPPPSTHFGYTIEWILLAMATFGVAFLMQAFPRKKKSGALKSTILVLAISAFSFPHAVQAEEKPAEMYKKVGFDEQLGEHADLSLKFHTQNGKEVELNDLILSGRPLVIAPVYYKCPRLCSLTLNGVVELLNSLKLALGKDFTLAAVSIDPTETAELASAKAKNYLDVLERPEEGKAGWYFLTGNQENTSALMRQIGFQYRPDGDDFSHAAGLIMLSPRGKVTRYFYGVQYQPQDFRLSLVEASQGKVGNAVDKVLLYCFRFDPTKGKYSLAIMNVIRAVSLVVFVGLGTALIRMRVKEVRVREKQDASAN